MILKDISFNSPEENILYDDVLLSFAEKENGEEVLRFWESNVTFIVLGRISKEDRDLKIDNIIKDKIPVLRRSSGGGTVVQGKGCLNYSLILSKKIRPSLNDIRHSYEIISKEIVGALSQLGVESQHFPISDIAFSQSKKKFSGNAQKRGRNYILHHGTLLYDFSINKISDYLAFPDDIPEYRNKRSHQDFIANLELSVDDIKNVIKIQFSINGQGRVLENEKSSLEGLLKAKNIRINF